MELEGGCLCGAVRYRIDGKPWLVEHCHRVHCRCSACAPFVTWAENEQAQLRFTPGEPGSCSSRPDVTGTFCTRCGTRLTCRRDDAPGGGDVTVGSLDEPGRLAPVMHIWCDRKLGWMRFDDGLPQHALRRPRE